MKTKTLGSLESIKWIAQIVGFATTSGLIIFLFAEVIPGIRDGRADIVIPMLPLLILGIVGYFISFFFYKKLNFPIKPNSFVLALSKDKRTII